MRYGRYNKPGFSIFDYDIYVVAGDGCLMEGIGSEAASLAGHLGLDNLCWIYDNNHITIEGKTDIAFTEDVAARFQGYGWSVLRVGDANELDRIEQALRTFRETKGRPTLVILDSHIGFGSPHKIDTAAAHGEPLGDEEVRLVKRSYGWPEDAQFLVPEGVRKRFAAGIGARGAAARERWTELFASYRSAYPELAREIDQTREYRDGVLPPEVKARIAIEQASTFGWDRYIGPWGQVIGMKTFGASAPLKELQKKFGFQPERVVAAAKTLSGKA